MLIYAKDLISSAALFFWGELTNSFIALHVFVFIEVVTLFMRVVSEKNWRQYINNKKVVQLVSIYILIGLGNIIDTYLCVGEGGVRDTLIQFYIAYEGILIISNLPIPIPKVISNYISSLKE